MSMVDAFLLDALTLGTSIPASTIGAPVLGVRLDSCENHLVEGNVLDIADENLIHFLFSSGVNAFNNLTPAGAAVPLSEDLGFNQFPRRETLEDKVRDAVIFSML